MCSYNITLSDSLVEKVRPSFADDKALTLWLQQQMEEILLNRLTQQKQGHRFITDRQAIPDVVLSLLGAGMPLADDDLNGRNAYYQHLEEKHQ
jgi:hypothetical protein